VTLWGLAPGKAPPNSTAKELYYARVVRYTRRVYIGACVQHIIIYFRDLFYNVQYKNNNIYERSTRATIPGSILYYLPYIGVIVVLRARTAPKFIIIVIFFHCARHSRVRSMKFPYCKNRVVYIRWAAAADLVRNLLQMTFRETRDFSLSLSLSLTPCPTLSRRSS